MFDRLQSCRSQGLAALAALALFGLSQAPARADIGPYILIDAKTGSVLEEHDATRKWYPASLTKMMTAYVAFKAIRDGKASAQSAVVQSQNSLAQPPSKMGFKVGTQLTLDNALTIMLVKSANDIAVAVAEAVGGSEPAFIEMMNQEARRLGMKDTTFVNPHGLPDNRQISSARDMAVLAMALRRDFPEARDYYKHPGIQFGKKTLRSANREFLLRVNGADGMKTGYICNSGYNVAASVTRDGKTLIAVVLGAASGLERTAFTRALIDKGFKMGSNRYTLDNLPRNGGTPPPDRYCKTNAEPNIETLMTLYDLQAKKSFILSFLDSGDRSSPLIPGMEKAKKADPASAESVKLANGKVDWNKVLDRTIGPRRIAYAPVEVRLGTPKGSTSPKLPVAAGNIPIPTPHPDGGAEEVGEDAEVGEAAEIMPAAGAMAQKDFVKSSGQQGQAAPGSLFQKRNASGIPVPTPKPKG